MIAAQNNFNNGTSGQTRTDTPVWAIDFESIASTNSATEAFFWKNITFKIIKCQKYIYKE